MLAFNILFLVIGFLLTFMVVKNPDNFLRFFLAAIIIGTGVKINGYLCLMNFGLQCFYWVYFLRKIFVTKLNFEKSESKIQFT